MIEIYIAGVVACLFVTGIAYTEDDISGDEVVPAIVASLLWPLTPLIAASIIIGQWIGKRMK